MHADDRGRIVDIFYDQAVNHVAVIDSIADIVRGNHYHKLTTQHMLITRGALEYWSKPVDSDEPAKLVVLRADDFVTSPPYEVHAMKILEDNTQFVVFSQGLRGGKDYEADTYRVPSIIPK